MYNTVMQLVTVVVLYIVCSWKGRVQFLVR